MISNLIVFYKYNRIIFLFCNFFVQKKSKAKAKIIETSRIKNKEQSKLMQCSFFCINLILHFNVFILIYNSFFKFDGVIFPQ